MKWVKSYMGKVSLSSQTTSKLYASGGYKFRKDSEEHKYRQGQGFVTLL
jgi:hypothetical protein